MSYHRDFLDFDKSIMVCNLIGEGVDTKKKKSLLAPDRHPPWSVKDWEKISSWRHKEAVKAATSTEVVDFWRCRLVNLDCWRTRSGDLVWSKTLQEEADEAVVSCCPCPLLKWYAGPRHLLGTMPEHEEHADKEDVVEEDTNGGRNAGKENVHWRIGPILTVNLHNIFNWTKWN